MVKKVLFSVSIIILIGVSSIYYASGQSLVSINKETMSDPALMMGSDFLRVFQSYYKIGDWNMLLRLTSSSTLKRYGRKKMLAFYKQMELGYTIHLLSITKHSKGYEMSYMAKIQATHKVIRCFIVIEQDTCRLENFSELNSRAIFER